MEIVRIPQSVTCIKYVSSLTLSVTRSSALLLFLNKKEKLPKCSAAANNDNFFDNKLFATWQFSNFQVKRHLKSYIHTFSVTIYIMSNVSVS